MITRLLIIRRMCPYCRRMIEVVSKINLRLPIDKKIHIIDCYEYEEFDLENLPIMKKLEKDGLSEGFPFLYIDGICLENAPTPKQMEILLQTFLKQDLLYLRE